MLFPFFHFCNNKNIFFLLLFLIVVLKVNSFCFNSCCHYNIPRLPNCQLLFWRKNAQIFVSFFYFKNLNFWIDRILIQWYIIVTIEMFSFRKHKYSDKKKKQLPFCSCSFFIFHVLISSGRMQIKSVSFYRQIGHSQFAFATCSWTPAKLCAWFYFVHDFLSDLLRNAVLICWTSALPVSWSFFSPFHHRWILPGGKSDHRCSPLLKVHQVRMPLPV